MKISIQILLFLLVSNYCLAQQPTADGHYCFDGINSTQNGDIVFYKDTISNPYNIWQIGVPHKTVFDTVSTLNNIVIVTDTVNAYPVNDTSSFIFEQVLDFPSYQTQQHYFGLNGGYYSNSDSLTDYGKIEISMKNSNVWYDVLNDTSLAYDFFTNPNNKPILTGNSNGPQGFYIDFFHFAYLLNLQTNDTMLIKFTFISDSIQTNKDGLMFGCFNFFDYYESVNDIATNIPSSIFPNPAFDHITLKTPPNQSFKKMNIDIFESTGRKVKSLELPYQEALNISVNDLAEGLYYYKTVYDNKAFSDGKFTVMP